MNEEDGCECLADDLLVILSVSFSLSRRFPRLSLGLIWPLLPEIWPLSPSRGEKRGKQD